MKFNLKSLAFYGGAIGAVVALFSFATAYGEANLKAPTKLDGRYRIAAQALPGCLKAEALILTIKQSGIYLSGSLLNADETDKTLTASKKQSSLTGMFDREQLTLSGVPSHLDACLKTAQIPEVLVQCAVTGGTITGKIRLGSGSAGVNFVGKRETPSS
ncbi:MAG: hypothetical protein LH660_02500 [Phormidesmis sp. CAN_BIN36]|nr:hypothetical protein [Phormidesmis sp. CAN_BIN36]